ncbi:hypothetical protein, partial [Endozoicomonas sp.]|uniref:hypothetical protein n=1 Tax=Endozoicomonas sp. TaxID=1892382 RepID=UPI00383BE67D
RAYHAKNAEKIRARQKAAYDKRTKARPAKEKLVRKKKNITYSNPDKPLDPTYPKRSVTAADRKSLMIRRRIEDWLLAKELGIEKF